MCAEMNYLPDEANDLTVGEIMRYYRGGQVRQSRSWEQTRELMFLIYRALGSKGTKDVYDFLPLMTDPTETERAEMKAEKEEELKKTFYDIINFWQSKGLA